MNTDHVFEKPEGWYAVVGNNVYGYWRSKAEMSMDTGVPRLRQLVEWKWNSGELLTS